MTPKPIIANAAAVGFPAPARAALLAIRVPQKQLGNFRFDIGKTDDRDGKVNASPPDNPNDVFQYPIRAC